MARLVVKVFDHKKVSLVVENTSICILLALVLDYELKLAQLDVKMKFLHGDVEKEI